MVIVTTAAGCQEVGWEDIFQLGNGRPSQWHCNIVQNVVVFKLWVVVNVLFDCCQ